MLRSYLVIAGKVLLRRPFFTFVSLFAISFTLVVLVTATSIMDHMLGPMAPETRQDRTLGVHYLEMTGPGIIWNGNPGYRFLDRYVRSLPDVERVSLFTEAALSASYQTGEKSELYLKRTDGQFWQVLTFDFLEGRPITESEEELGSPVAVINASTRELLYGDTLAVGKEISIDGQRFEVIGVVADVSILREDPFSDVWVPISTSKDSNYREGFFGDLNALVLAHDRADFPAIKSELASRLGDVELPSPDFDKVMTLAETAFEKKSREMFDSEELLHRPRRLALMIVLITFLFMLLPSVNLININVSRIMERSSEIGVRKAFGASSSTLVGQFIVENLAMTLVGGAIGFGLSAFVLRVLSNSDFVPYAQFHLNWRVFLYGLALTVIFGLLSGVYPAWKMSRMHPVDALRGR